MTSISPWPMTRTDRPIPIKMLQQSVNFVTQYKHDASRRIWIGCEGQCKTEAHQTCIRWEIHVYLYQYAATKISRRKKWYISTYSRKIILMLKNRILKWSSDLNKFTYHLADCKHPSRDFEVHTFSLCILETSW